jgi:hypothetical protein
MLSVSLVCPFLIAPSVFSNGLLQLSMTASSCYPALCDNDNLAKAAKGKEGVRRNHVMEKMLIQIRIKKKCKALKKTT